MCHQCFLFSDKDEVADASEAVNCDQEKKPENDDSTSLVELCMFFAQPVFDCQVPSLKVTIDHWPFIM